MIAARFVGGAVAALAVGLLYGHARRYQQLLAEPPSDPHDARYAWDQVRRRSQGSALMALLGGAIAVAERVPKTPTAASLYLFALVAATLGLVVYGFADWRATAACRDRESIDALRGQLSEHLQAFIDEQPSDIPPRDGAPGGEQADSAP